MKNKKTRLRLEADKLFKNACLLKWGKKCEICKGSYLATPHHYFYKSSFSHLRFDTDNGVILDAQCHARLHFKDPKIVEEQIIKVRGMKWLNKLKKKALNPPKYFKFDNRFLEKSIKELLEKKLF